MCADAAKAALNLGTFGLAKKAGIDDALFPSAPKLKFPKPPTAPDTSKAATLAAQHAKDQATAAYAAANTNLTGGKGLGSAPAANKSLWKTLGAS